MNLFIAIILQGYFSQFHEDKLSEKKSLIENFREQWAKFDPKATTKIGKHDLPQLLFNLGRDFGWSESFKKSE